ncbi:MotA/TolQ/ExbB proton channel family protein [Polaribacter sp. Asnod1-A03]|uniref:MotA/TolQ/ExbB proton channel family protein n=1 Tax=Polaribacter sp. Asnod1-A03 TaxID=3160581 RepID=UPI003867329A
MKYIIEGDTKFMIPLIILLLLTLFLIMKGFKTNSEKNRKLIKSVSLFALVFGFFGLFIGLYQMFTVIAIANSVSHGVLAVGLKCAITATLFGFIIFLIGRLGVIALTWIKKE